VSNLSAPTVAFPSPVELNSRKYLKPPPKRKGAAQALIWNFMLPYSSEDGQRTVECCVLVPCEATGGMRKCGATFKHKMGALHTVLQHVYFASILQSFSSPVFFVFFFFFFAILLSLSRLVYLLMEYVCYALFRWLDNQLAEAPPPPTPR
jgi:hypothetical protein